MITYDGALLMKGLLHLYEKQENRIIKRLSGRCIYMIHSDGRQPFTTVYYADIYSLPVTLQHLFGNLQLHILFLNPIQLLAVQMECKSNGFTRFIHVIRYFSDRGSGLIAPN